MSQPPIRSRTRLGAAAGLLGALAAFTAVTGVGPAPSIFQLTGAVEDVSGNCDEAEHANDPECAGTPAVPRSGDDSSTSSTSSTVDDSSTSTTAGSSGAPAGAEIRTVSAGEAGSVMVAVEGLSLRLLSATPGQGWRAEVEQAIGREIEVTFESGSRRVDVNVEIEDGQVRERVRTRNDATGTETRTENGVVVRDEGPDDDSSGSSGSDDSDDSSGSSGSDDSSGRDDSDDRGSGHGGDDNSDDDDSSGRGGDDDSSGHGSDGPNHD